MAHEVSITEIKRPWCLL